MSFINHLFGRNIKVLGLLLTIILSCSAPSIAQVFPVQATIHVAPPYSVYLSQYTASDQEKIMTTILLRDPVIPFIDVKFRFTVEGGGIKLTTNPAWNPQPYTLTAGISTMLPQDLIAEYLKPQHLLVEGVNPQEFYRSGRLPEGFYEFKVEVIEYRRGISISNLARTGLWLLLNEPPRITYPLPNQKVIATNPQMLNFTWIPGGISSPQASMNTQYEFTLVELTDRSVDPTVAITTASNATKFVKVIDQTNLLYGSGEMPLTPGKRYAIRVKAFNTDGIEMFKNGGYSPVSVFTFGDACLTPASFVLESPTQSSFTVRVITDPGNTAWQARFREQSSTSADLQSVTNSSWSELNPDAGANTKTPRGLKASTAYEVQVKGLCGDVPSDFTQSKTITTKPLADPNRSCNGNATPFAADNAPALQRLKVDDIFLAALFPIQVKAIKSQSGGKFSGSGIATLPLFNTGLAVTFDNVGINERMQLTSGEVKVVRNELNLTLFGDTPPPTRPGGNANPNHPSDTTTTPPITDTLTIPAVYDSLVVTDNNTVIIYPPNGGAPVTVNLGGGTCTLLMPADGNMDNAQVVYDGSAHPYVAGNGRNGGNGQNRYSGFLAHFKPSEAQVYGFDSLRFAQHTSFYQEMEVNRQLVKLPWKALEQGKYDRVTLTIQRSSTAYPYSNLKVSVLGGADLIPVAGSDTPKRTYSLLGKADGDQEAIVATYQDSSRTNYAGGIWTASYTLKPFKLFLVPMPGINISDVDRGLLQQNLNTKIYSQAVVTWSVGALPGITGVDLGANCLDWADNALLSSYNAEMNSVISAFKTWKPNADPDAYYLFIVPKFSESGVEGFMPRNRRFGFVTYEQLKDRTVAHELGHGAFNLRHTFPEVPQGTSKNLMDYPSGAGQASDGIELYKPQWDLIHNPEFTTGLWDGMEDGASASCIYTKPEQGTKEGEYKEVQGSSFEDHSSQKCMVDLYYHTGCIEPTKKGWYKPDEYFEIVKYIVKDIAIVRGDLFYATLKKSDIDFARNNIDVFFNNNNVSTDFFKAIKPNYAQWITEFRLSNGGSGTVYEVPIVYDIIDFLSGFGAVKEIPKLFNFNRLIKVFGLKFNGKKVVTETGEVLAEYSDNILKNIKFADGEVKVLGGVDEIVDYEINGVVRTGKLDVVEVSGKKALRMAEETEKFTSKQINDYVILATKNQNAKKVMLGKYGDGGSTSYIQRAGNEYTYFDMGTEKWKEAEALVNKNADEMWKINKQFIDEQKALGKEFYFSHEPWKAQTHEYLSKEAEYLIDLGAKDFVKINENTWKVVW